MIMTGDDRLRTLDCLMLHPELSRITQTLLKWLWSEFTKLFQEKKAFPYSTI